MDPNQGGTPVVPTDQPVVDPNAPVAPTMPEPAPAAPEAPVEAPTEAPATEVPGQGGDTTGGPSPV